jgi:LacI family transcriptional regulator
MAAARQLLALNNPPTAIFASNDQSAIGAYQIANETGLRVPEDLSLVGFDNTPDAAYMNLTSVDQFIADMGFIGTRMLVDLINGIELESPHHIVETSLVVRDSCRAI